MSNPPVTMTDAEKWELQARSQEVENARLRVLLAEAAQQGALTRVLAAHDLPLDGRYRLLPDGRLQQETP